MSTQVDPAHNLTALLIGTGEFSFSENALTPADAQVRGWLDFGNLMAFTPDIKPTKLQHTGSYRGVRKVDRQVTTQIQTNYKLKLDEMNLEVVRLMYGASDTTAFTQVAMSAANGAALGFGSTAAVIGKWYDLLTVTGNQLIAGAAISTVGSGYLAGDVLTIAGGTGTSATILVNTVSGAGAITGVSVLTGGSYSANPTSPNTPTGGTGTGAILALSFGLITANQIRNVTTVTISGKVEGTDFVVDLLNGRIKFLTAQASNLTPVITAPAITASDANSFYGMIPMNTPTRRGYGRLTVYDQDASNKVAMQHWNFSCDITLDTASETDGTKWNEVTVDVLVTSDPGILYTRRGNANSGVAA